MTIDEMRAAKMRGEKIAVLTAYDYPTARLLDESGVDAVLVGDSLGMVVLGFPDTTWVTMEDMVHHTRAVRRGVKRALVIVDLPIRSCRTPEAAAQNAQRLVSAGADAVKLEGGASHVEHVGAIAAENIPAMAHIGMMPQRVLEEGGYKIKGRTPEQIEALLADARAVEKAGAFALLLELVVPDVAEKISHAISIPTIGIGSGRGCDGQVLVTHDLIGLFPWFTPKFVSKKANVADAIRAAAGEFVRETKQEAGRAMERCGETGG